MAIERSTDVGIDEKSAKRCNEAQSYSNKDRKTLRHNTMSQSRLRQTRRKASRSVCDVILYGMHAQRFWFSG